MAIYGLFFSGKNMQLRLHLGIFEDRMITLKSNSFKRHVRNKQNYLGVICTIFLNVILHSVCGDLQKGERECKLNLTYLDK